MDNYFDLHFHPVAKNHLAQYNDDMSYKRGNGELTKAIEMSKAFKDFTDETILRTLESQCCIDYLEDGKVNLGVAAIAALEFGVASSKGFFSSVLKGNLTRPFSKHYFDVVSEGQVSYLNLFLREVEQYMALKKSGAISVLNRKNIHKFNEKSLKLTFAIEGGHNLCMKKIGNALKYDEFKDIEKSAVLDPKTIASNNPATVLEELVKKFREKDLDVLYLTLTHLTHIPEQHLATHAFATKALKHPSFYPFGNGLSELGLEVIDKAYSLPVLIDIAHMSLKSRLDFYKYRKDKDYENIPIIASHVGVTGYSINDWKHNLDTIKCVNHVDQGIKTVKMYTKPKVAGYWGSNLKKEFTFNPNTINLMDEDIIEVVNSKGIIGVSLDISILGYESGATPEIDSSEFLTTADFMTHFPYTGLQS
uniref:membrane dipeptidase n=1 Tax=Pricia sp. TaxID=2268138 RepID=UPI0035947C05